MAKLYEIVAELQDFVTANEGLEDEQAYIDTLEALHSVSQSPAALRQFHKVLPFVLSPFVY